MYSVVFNVLIKILEGLLTSNLIKGCQLHRGIVIHYIERKREREESCNRKEERASVDKGNR